MRKALAMAILVFALATLPGPSHANDGNSGNDFLPWCKQWLDPGTTDTEDVFGAAVCSGFVLAARDLVSTLQSKICIPVDVTNGQMARVFVKYMEEHPQDLHMRASFLFLLAAREGFPCD